MAVTFIQIVLGYGPFAAALWMLPTVGGSLAGVVAASIYGRFIRPAFLIAAGLVTCAPGFFWVRTIEPNSHLGLPAAGHALRTAAAAMPCARPAWSPAHAGSPGSSRASRTPTAAC